MKTLRSMLERSGINSRVAMVFVRFLAAVTAIYVVAIIVGGWQLFGHDRVDVLKSLFVSFGGNLAFLIVAGLVPTILAFTEPKKEPIQQRVDYLITNDDVSQGARAHIKTEVIKLCAYYEAVEVYVRILEVREDGAFYAEFLTNSLVRNTFQSDALSDPEYNLMVEPDSITLEAGSSYGEINLAEVIHNETQSTQIIAKPERIRTPGRYIVRFGINVPPAGTSRVRLNFRIWCDGDLACYYHFYRYAENARIILENETSDDLKLFKLDEPDKIEIVSPTQNLLLLNGPVKTGRLRLFKMLSRDKGDVT